MLIHLSIKNIVIIEHLELDFKKGMTVLTGETGAGKSILLESLGFSLGERSDKTLIRQGAESAEVTAVYDIQKMPDVAQWLIQNNLVESETNDSEINNSEVNNSEEKNSKIDKNLSNKQQITTECIIRRTLNKEGRSRCFINGILVPISQLKDIAELLVNIHGQHQNQLLLRTEHQRTLLDEYSNHPQLLIEVQNHYFTWQKCQQELSELKKEDNQQDKLTLLNYQIEEFKELKLKANEIQELDIEHKTLSHAEQWIGTISETVQLLQNDSSFKDNLDLDNLINAKQNNQQDIIYALQRAIQNLKSFTAKQTSNVNNVKNNNINNNNISNAISLFQNAQVQIEEGLSELNFYLNSINLDPARLKVIDERLSHIHSVARKHKVPIEQLTQHFEKLNHQADALAHRDAKIKLIQDQIEKTEKLYFKAATELSASRQKHAKLLEQKVTAGIHSLEMPKGQFKIGFTIKEKDKNKDKDKDKTTDKAMDKNKDKDIHTLSKHGIDDIEFLVCTNPGQSLQPLRKIASGGELSRISLCIQVITAEKMTTPTLIFDEVDVGISGKTATVVGELMRQIGQTTQVFCVTHLPQVAALGHQHFCVSKNQLKNKTDIFVTDLNYNDRITEIARMFAGDEISDSAVNHAKTILNKIHKQKSVEEVQVI